MCSVKYVKFYDDDIRFWTAWKNRAAASELSIAASSPTPPIGPGPAALRGRRFLVTCSTNKAVFLDLVTMKARDVPKAALDNKAPLWYVSQRFALLSVHRRFDALIVCKASTYERTSSLLVLCSPLSLGCYTTL